MGARLGSRSIVGGFMTVRRPTDRLRPFVRALWVARSESTEPLRESVLPTGTMHLVVRVSERSPLVYADSGDRVGVALPDVVLGGARDRPYLRETGVGGVCVGAQLTTGTAQLLFGVPADRLAGVHTDADDLDPAWASHLCELVASARDPQDALARFEQALVDRLPRVRGLHPAVAYALDELGRGSQVGALVRDSGYSHRHFISLFRSAVGLSPRTYLRLQRFGRALRALSAGRGSLAEVAYDAGYADQSHFQREFRRVTGMTPGAYATASPAAAHHVPVVEPQSDGG